MGKTKLAIRVALIGNNRTAPESLSRWSRDTWVMCKDLSVEPIHVNRSHNSLRQAVQTIPQT